MPKFIVDNAQQEISSLAIDSATAGAAVAVGGNHSVAPGHFPYTTNRGRPSPSVSPQLHHHHHHQNAHHSPAIHNGIRILPMSYSFDFSSFFFSYFDGCLCVFSVLSIHLPPSKCRLTANYIFLSYIDFFTDYRLGGVRESIWQPSEGKAQLLRNDDDFRFVSDNLFSDQLQGMTTLENCDGFMPIRNSEYVASSMGVLMLPNSQIIYIYIV